jgi:hypothetical protein
VKVNSHSRIAKIHAFVLKSTFQSKRAEPCIHKIKIIPASAWLLWGVFPMADFMNPVDRENIRRAASETGGDWGKPQQGATPQRFRC